MADSATFKVLLGFEDGVTTDCAAIEYQGAIWLVPKWMPFPGEGYAKPERTIRLDQFRYQAIPQPAEADFGISEPLPRSLFDGPLSEKLKSAYVVLDRPDVRFRTGGTRH
jgi:hypothetical protein